MTQSLTCYPNLRFAALACIVLFASCGERPDSRESSNAALLGSYPQTDTVEHVDEYHGVSVADPYRWLEADVREDAAVRRWVDQQAEFASTYLKSLPNWQVLNDRLTEIWYTERYGTPYQKNGRYFYSYTDGRMNQAQVFVSDAPAEPGSILFDPNTWSQDGTTALGSYHPAPAGDHVAYMVQEAGSDWRTIKVRNLVTGVDTDDEIPDIKFSNLSWDAAGEGFFYTKFKPPEGERFLSRLDNARVMYHRLGTPVARDRLIHADPQHPERGFSGEVTHDGRYLVITSSIGTADRYQVYIKDLQADTEVQQIVSGFDHDYSLVDHIDGELFFRSDLDAPNGRVIAMRLHDGRVREIVGERDNVLTRAHHFGGRFVLQYLQDASSRIEVHSLDGEHQTQLQLPGIGSVAGLSGGPEQDEVFYAYSSLNRPSTIRRWALDSNAQSTFRQIEMGLDLDGMVVKQEFFSSRDGTRVPMFIMHKKDSKLDGKLPTLLYGYGGFNISLTPGFSMSRALFVEQGGAVAIANLRGGGEYGEEWHAAGTLTNKQNVFDDFIAAAEHLIATGYTAPEHLGIMGGSNGGLLVGAVLNQRPELFGAALPLVGVMDMLRFEAFTAGRYWVDDYGSVTDPEQFAALRAYSPYHNIAEREYPPVLVGTADTDDRVVPGHSFKYAARLQALQQGDAPILLRVERSAGHGAGKPTSKRIEEYTDYWAFLLHHLG
ncbi:MAG: prolyl oligopeptidase family serine peptidase [Pseudomonadota bacterium]